MKKMKVGGKVELLQIPAPLKHRRTPICGRITNIDSSYILVRPLWCTWEVECYPNELKII